MVDPGLTANLQVLPNPTKNTPTLPIPTIMNTVSPIPPENDLAAGTPGVFGLLTGAVPIPIQVPVSVEVKWKVKKNDAEIQPGQGYLAPKGLSSPILELVFLALKIEELDASFSPAPDHYTISATVTVKALGLSSGPVEVPDPKANPPLPPITLDIPAILGIPTVLALFRHSNYAVKSGDDLGSALLVVPNNAALKSANDLVPVLDTLRETITRLQSFKQETVSTLDLATFLLGLGTLIDAVNDQPQFQLAVAKFEPVKKDDVVVREAHGIPNLDQIIFSESGWRVFPPRMGGKDDAADEASAVILISVGGNGVKLWGDPSFSDQGDSLGDHLSLELFVGPVGWATIQTLDGEFKQPTDVAVFPPGAFVQNVINRNPKNFNDTISSIEFIKPQPV